MRNKPLKFPELYYPNRSNELITTIQNYKYTEISDTLNDLIILANYASFKNERY